MNHFHRFIESYMENFDLNNIDATPDKTPIDVQKLYVSLTKDK